MPVPGEAASITSSLWMSWAPSASPGLSDPSSLGGPLPPKGLRAGLGADCLERVPSPAAHDTQPDARVPQRALHLGVGLTPALPLHALGQVHPPSRPWGEWLFPSLSLAGPPWLQERPGRGLREPFSVFLDE